MRYLGLDLGTKTLGVAITDKANIIASPLKTIHFNFEDYGSALEEVIKIANEYGITELALGMPLNMNGTKGFATERSLNFKKMLEDSLNLPVTLIDERLTSVQAHNILSNNGSKEINHKKVVDAVAATLILETFLKRKESSHE